MGMACAALSQLYRVEVGVAQQDPASAAVGWGGEVTLEQALLRLLDCLGVNLKPARVKRPRTGGEKFKNSIMKKFKEMCQEENEEEVDEEEKEVEEKGEGEEEEERRADVREDEGVAEMKAEKRGEVRDEEEETSIKDQQISPDQIEICEANKKEESEPNSIVHCNIGDCNKKWYKTTPRLRLKILTHFIKHQHFRKMIKEAASGFYVGKKCLTCEKKFTDIGRLMFHFVTYHDLLKAVIEKELVCTMNYKKGQKVTETHGFEQHHSIVAAGKENIEFESENANRNIANQHLIAKESADCEGKIVQCIAGNCERTFNFKKDKSTEISVYRHIFTHFKDEMKQFTEKKFRNAKCLKCSKRLKRPNYIEKSTHLLRNHNISRPNIDFIYRKIFDFFEQKEQKTAENTEPKEKHAGSVNKRKQFKGAKKQKKTSQPTEENGQSDSSPSLKQKEVLIDSYISCSECGFRITRGKSKKYLYKNVKRHAISHFKEIYFSLYKNYFTDSDDCSSCETSSKNTTKTLKNWHLYRTHSVKLNEVNAIYEKTMGKNIEATSDDNTDDVDSLLLDSDDEDENQIKNKPEAGQDDLSDIQKRLWEQMDEDSDSDDDQETEEKSTGSKNIKEEQKNTFHDESGQGLQTHPSVKSEQVKSEEVIKDEKNDNREYFESENDIVCDRLSKQLKTEKNPKDSIESH